MLTNIIDEKTHNFAHSAPQTVTRRRAPERPKPVVDYPLKREREKGVRSNCGVIPWANCAAISPSTDANLKP